MASPSDYTSLHRVTSISTDSVLVVWDESVNGEGYITVADFLKALQVDVSATTYTLSASDDKKLLRFTSGSAVTVTVPGTLAAGWSVTIIQDGAGQITFSASGSTINEPDSYTKTEKQYAVVSLYVKSNSTGSNAVLQLDGRTAA